jgi:hypothetical protein
MAGEIRINYDDVYGKTAELRNRITSEIGSMENECRQIQTMLDGVDGAANAAIKRAVETNREKALIAAMTLNKLCSFAAGSSMQVETVEQKVKGFIASFFNSFRGGAS